MKYKSLIFCILIIAVTSKVFSQVTISEVKKTKDSVATKPEPYDSLQRFERQKKNIDYKKYIGLDFYLPPFSNPDIGATTIQDRPFDDNKRFAFSTKPTTTNIDTSHKTLKIEKRWHHLKNPSGGWESATFTKIFTYIYKPFIYNKGEVVNSKKIGNKYYRLIDVLYGDTLKNLCNNMASNLIRKQKKVDEIFSRYKKDLRDNPNSQIWENNDEKTIVDTDLFENKNSEPIFVFRSKNNGDTLLCIYPKRFFLVPYIVKQKQIYEGKTLIFNNKGYYEFSSRNFLSDKLERIVVPDESKWYCEKIDLIPSGREYYKLYYVLKNKNGKTITLQNLSGNNHKFMTEQEYEQKQRKEKLEEQKLRAEKRRKEKLKRQKKKKKQEEHRAKCIEKYGKHLGELIAQGKVKIGMSQDMCKTAWGKPLWKSETTTQHGHYEDWYYGFGFSLHFRDGELIRIEK